MPGLCFGSERSRQLHISPPQVANQSIESKNCIYNGKNYSKIVEKKFERKWSPIIQVIPELKNTSFFFINICLSAASHICMWLMFDLYREEILYDCRWYGVDLVGCKLLYYISESSFNTHNSVITVSSSYHCLHLSYILSFLALRHNKNHRS